MTDQQSPQIDAHVIIGADGERITLAQLPRRGIKRWLPRHKAMVVAAVRLGLLTFGEACKRYPAYAEEYLTWHSSTASDRQ